MKTFTAILDLVIGLVGILCVVLLSFGVIDIGIEDAYKPLHLLTGILSCIALAVLYLLRQSLYERFWIHRYLNLGSGLIAPASILLTLYLVGLIVFGVVAIEAARLSDNTSGDSVSIAKKTNGPDTASESQHKHITDTVNTINNFTTEIAFTSGVSTTNRFLSGVRTSESTLITSTAELQEQSSTSSNIAPFGPLLQSLAFRFVHLSGALAIGLFVLIRLFVSFEESITRDSRWFVTKAEWMWMDNESDLQTKKERLVEWLKTRVWLIGFKEENVVAIKWDSDTGTVTIGIRKQEAAKLRETPAKPASTSENKSKEPSDSPRPDWDWEGYEIRMDYRGFLLDKRPVRRIIPSQTQHDADTTGVG